MVELLVGAMLHTGPLESCSSEPLAELLVGAKLHTRPLESCNNELLVEGQCDFEVILALGGGTFGMVKLVACDNEL